MRVSKLYLKIFLAFLAVLIAAESSVFIFVLSGRPPSPFIRTVVGETIMADRLIRKELAETETGDAMANRLGPVMRILDKEHRRIWVTDANGTVLAASFGGLPPILDMALSPVELTEGEPVRMYKAEGRRFKGIYLESDIETPRGEPILLHVLIDRPHHNEETWFLKGLLLLTVLGALFILPVALRIIRPIRKLAEATDRLGHGDFSQRVPVTGRDEVADLANKFNNMAGRLQKLVLSGRELTAQLSHELRTPLARMRISLQMVMERGGGEGADRRYLDKISDEIDNMDRIIGSILDLSKLDMQEAPPRTDRVDVSARLGELLESYGPMVERQNFLLETDLGPTPALRCNAHALDVLLNNVLANAMKYTEEGGAIEVRAKSEAGHIAVEVANAHPPMSDKDLKDMFIPFHRLYRGNKAGTGLGLTTARRMAEMHGGTIDSSWSDGRTRIRIELPLG